MAENCLYCIVFYAHYERIYLNMNVKSFAAFGIWHI